MNSKVIEMDQICRLLLSDIDTGQVFLKNCTQEQSVAINKAFNEAAESIGLTPVNGSPELFEAQLRALDWTAVDGMAQELRCLWVNEDGTQCNLDIYRNGKASANPFMVESSTPSPSGNPFQGASSKPVNIPGAVYLGITLIVLFYFAAYQGFSIAKVQAFLVRFVNNLKKYGKRTSA